MSIETGGPKDENGKATPLEIASSDDMVAEITDRIMVQQCLSLLSETDREILDSPCERRNLCRSCECLRL